MQNEMSFYENRMFYFYEFLENMIPQNPTSEIGATATSNMQDLKLDINPTESEYSVGNLVT